MCARRSNKPFASQRPPRTLTPPPGLPVNPAGPTSEAAPGEAGTPAAPPVGGWLALVATPIGNLEDMTFRAVRTLNEATLIAAEDTRRAGILLHHYGIKAPATPYHSHNEHGRTAGLLDRVARGERVALLTDAGTPSISDPGFLLVREALARGIEPIVVPGVSALTMAAVACGFPVSELLFCGYLPNKGARRRTMLARLAPGCQTLVVFESPFRVNKLLTEIVETLGPDTPVALLRELTKRHEECLRGTAAALLARHGNRTWKGEFTVAIHCGTTSPETGGEVRDDADDDADDRDAEANWDADEVDAQADHGADAE